jgi:hypothetical protein
MPPLENLSLVADEDWGGIGRYVEYDMHDVVERFLKSIPWPGQPVGPRR